MRILVTGADGLVGTHFLNYAREAQNFICPDETEMDITNPEQVDTYISENSPKCVINFAAYTDTKNSENQRGNEQGSVWKINVGGVKNLAKVCKEKGIFLIHISTDLIFSGKDDPTEVYYEDENYNSIYEKISWYGITKLESEKALIKSNNDFSLVRIAYPFAGPAHTKKDMLHTFLHLCDTGNLYPMFADNTITPTYIDDLSKTLNKIIEGHRTGVFHVASHGPVSHFDLAKYVLEKSGRDLSVLKPGSLEEFAKRSGIPRPLYINLDTKETEKTLNIHFGTWQENINDALTKLSF